MILGLSKNDPLAELGAEFGNEARVLPFEGAAIENRPPGFPGGGGGGGGGGNPPDPEMGGVNPGGGSGGGGGGGGGGGPSIPIIPDIPGRGGGGGGGGGGGEISSDRASDIPGSGGGGGGGGSDPGSGNTVEGVTGLGFIGGCCPLAASFLRSCSANVIPPEIPSASLTDVGWVSSVRPDEPL